MIIYELCNLEWIKPQAFRIYIQRAGRRFSGRGHWRRSVDRANRAYGGRGLAVKQALFDRTQRYAQGQRGDTYSGFHKSFSHSSILPNQIDATMWLSTAGYQLTPVCAKRTLITQLSLVETQLAIFFSATCVAPSVLVCRTFGAGLSHLRCWSVAPSVLFLSHLRCCFCRTFGAVSVAPSVLLLSHLQRCAATSSVLSLLRPLTAVQSA
jgi:hypothetical protein